MATGSTARTPTALRFLAAALLLLLPSCVAFPQPSLGAWPGTWPPTSFKCGRNDDVAFAWQTGSISAELTRLHADPHCVPQPSCRASVDQEQHQQPGDVWGGFTDHLFTIGDQDTIVANARNYAIAHTPPGKRFYRLAFTQGIIVGSGPSYGSIFATAYYGRCLRDLPRTSNPNPSSR